VIEALRTSILEPRDHLHINQKRTFTPSVAMHKCTARLACPLGRNRDCYAANDAKGS